MGKKIIKPVQSITGNRLNLDLANIMAGAVSEKMFQKIAEKEQQIRADANARTTTLLQKSIFQKLELIRGENILIAVKLCDNMFQVLILPAINYVNLMLAFVVCAS